ncbi:MAG: single-stranded DNA-binding protein [Kiritimatiellia bacterium]|jgi:single-strand DNA-binding protein
MASLNSVILVGNLTREPELRSIPSGTHVLEMGMAINDSYRNKAGEIVESTCFVEIVVWGRQAETCAKYLHKGSPALVEGRLQYDQWETKEGEKRSRLRVVASRVQFLGSPRRQEYNDAPAENPVADEQPAPLGPSPAADPDTPF